MHGNAGGNRKSSFGILWLACALFAGAWAAPEPAAGSIYALDLGWKVLAFTNRPALGEQAEIELRGIGAADPTNLTLYLANKDGDLLAIAEGMETTGTYARATLDLATTNLLAEFDGVPTSGSQTFDLSIWDAGRSVLLASAGIEIRHNPLWESLAFTNLPDMETLGLAEYLLRTQSPTGWTDATASFAVNTAWKSLEGPNSLALAERARIELTGVGDAEASGLMAYLSNRQKEGLALGTEFFAGTNPGTAYGLLNLATTNLLAEFDGSPPGAEKRLELTIWDSGRDVLLASGPVSVRHNPLARHFTEGWTNVTEAVAAEVQATADAALAKSDATSNELETAKAGIATLATGKYDVAAALLETHARVGADAALSNEVATLATEKLDAAATAAWEVGSHDDLLTKDEAENLYQPTGSYLTAETDAAWLAAAGGVQSNLTAHAADTNNPHNVTAAQLGALTEESDPGFTEWEPTAHVPVVCDGGWLYPDFFTISTRSYLPTGVTYGATSAYNSVNYQMRAGLPAGAVITPEVIHQRDWTETVHYTNLVNLALASNVEGTAYSIWEDGAESGDVGRATAVLGGFEKSVEVVHPGNVSHSNAWWVSDVEGSYRAAANAAVSNLAWASGKTNTLFSPWPYVATNFLRNTNCWASGIDLTCASPWNSHSFYYRPATLVTPQHVVGAIHWFAPTGTVFRWIDATNGWYERTLVDVRFLDNDVAVGLLDAELPAAITPAKVLSTLEIKRLRGKYGLLGAPGFRVVYVDARERAWQATSSFMEETWFYDFPQNAEIHGDVNIPYSQSGAVGGDSGSPVFIADGTNATLIGCFYSPNSAPFLAFQREGIESALVAMGNSTYTNLTAPDLSAWPDYDADFPSIPDW